MIRVILFTRLRDCLSEPRLAGRHDGRGRPRLRMVMDLWPSVPITPRERSGPTQRSGLPRARHEGRGIVQLLAVLEDEIDSTGGHMKAAGRCPSSRPAIPLTPEVCR